MKRFVFPAVPHRCRCCHGIGGDVKAVFAADVVATRDNTSSPLTRAPPRSVQSVRVAGDPVVKVAGT